MNTLSKNNWILGGTMAGLLTLSGGSVLAWDPPSDGCLAVRNELGVALDALQTCKETYPSGTWNTNCASERERFHACSELAVKRERGGICPDGDASEQPEKEALCFGAEESCPSVVGSWAASFDMNCDGVGDVNRTMVHSDDGTWNGVGFPNGGPWTQDNCDLEMLDNYCNPPMVWNATMTTDGNQLSGTFSGTVNGCWTATRNPPGSSSFGISTGEGEDPSGEDYYGQ